jgi:hypothetical protein
MSALTGSELLTAVKKLENEGLGQTEIARQTGYVTTKGDGTERARVNAFLEALLEAKGISLGGKKKSPGRSLTFRTQVQFNGNLMIGGAYTRQAGFNPGDSFEIIVGKKGFTLKPLAQGQAPEGCPDGTCPTTDEDSETEAPDPIDG